MASTASFCQDYATLRFNTKDPPFGKYDNEDGYKRSMPLPIPVTSLFRSRSIPKTWVYAQNGKDRRLTLIEDI